MNDSSDVYKPYHFLKECNDKIQLHICNCFNKLTFLPEVSSKLAKMHFFLDFGQKLPIQAAHHTFIESRHPEVTKNSYYVLSPNEEPKKGISSWTNSDYLNKAAKIKE